jgi:hypothetical protein
MERTKLLEIMTYLDTAVKKPDKHLKRRRKHQTNARSSAKRSKSDGRCVVVLLQLANSYHVLYYFLNNYMVVKI